MHKVYIGIGTNIEPRSSRMNEAIAALEDLGTLTQRSSIYETAPVGYSEQPDFLNAVVLLTTPMEVGNLHTELRRLELRLGRTTRPRWHEREIDFDILFFDELQLVSDELVIPHPESIHRSFVLIPMAEITPEYVHPVLNETIEVLLKKLTVPAGSIQLFNGIERP
ncbi:MAG: 2-amino-4-hydroxy-6-hydroxymethyldihydropteridine diphosphokinase [Ignavibacteriota bacterium]